MFYIQFDPYCSYGEQIRDVRHEYHLTSIHNLPSKLFSDMYALFVDVSVWTDLDPRGVTYGRDSYAQVS